MNKNNLGIKSLVLLIYSLLVIITSSLSGCVTFAPPASMITCGGPQTTRKGTSDAALAAASGVAVLQGTHYPGQGWFGRYKFGLSNKVDLGVDAFTLSHGDNFSFTTKIAARYQLLPKLRLEGGIGIADDTNAKSINSDFALTAGTVSEKSNWNYYISLRTGFAKGFPGSSISLFNSSANDSITPVNSGILLLNAGAQGKINENMKVFFESGYGYIFPGNYDSNQVFYISFGLMVHIGNSK